MSFAAPEIVRSLTGQSRQTEGAETTVQPMTELNPATGRMLIERLSYTHLAHEKTAVDQPSVGILLCTAKSHALVEYVLAGMDNQLFVSKDQLELPKPEELQRYIDEQRRLLEASDA